MAEWQFASVHRAVINLTSVGTFVLLLTVMTVITQISRMKVANRPLGSLMNLSLVISICGAHTKNVWHIDKTRRS